MNVTVYCASSFGHDPAFADEARALGAWIGANHHTLIYGGTNVGLMGLIAGTALDAGGHVIGVLPDILADREPPSGRLSEFYRVETMAQRKAKMIELVRSSWPCPVVRVRSRSFPRSCPSLN